MRFLHQLHLLSRATLLGTALGLVGLLNVAMAQPVVVAAADLKFALEEVAVQFEKQTGQKVRLIFGSSGNFYSQILQGAPYQMFLSADENFVFKLADAGKTRDRGKLYAIGRIGIMVPHGSVLRADSAFKDLALALKDGRLQKFAIAAPDHAPYGARAKEALQHAGLWAAIEPRLVLGENISQTTQFATSGSTQGGIIALSLALAPVVARLGNFALIPEAWHQPLRQRMVMLKDANQTVQAFYDYIGSPNAQAMMSRYGFVMPKE